MYIVDLLYLLYFPGQLFQQGGGQAMIDNNDGIQPGNIAEQDNQPRRRNVGQRPQHEIPQHNDPEEQGYRLRATNARRRDFRYTN